MKAAVLRKFGKPLSLEERPCPETRGDEILVHVRGTGVCHTDLHLIDGSFKELPLPRVLGHEIAGDVQGIGDVLVYASWGCGSCELCSLGEEQLCPNVEEAGWVRDGGYAEYVCIPSRRYVLPLDGLDPVNAAPLADAGVTPYRAVRRTRHWLRDGETALVIGAGGLGQFAIQYLKLLTDAYVVAVDPAETKRELATELGADEALPPAGADRPARVVLDFVGSEQTLALAAQVVERSGIVVLTGEAGGQLSFGIGSVPHETHLTTSIWGSRKDLNEVLEIARRGEIRWNVETLPLEKINAGLDRLRRGDVTGRLVVTP